MATKTVPVLGAARLSQESDETTSIERQTDGIQGWARLRSTTTGDDYRVTKVTEDSDVSGAVSPFDRPGLGPYLRKPLIDSWSALVVFRLDRLTRSIADFEALWKFLEAHGKTLVSVAEQIDFGTTAGRLMARQLVIFAEYEREMISQRVKNAYEAAQKQGKWPGLQFPFGYIPYKLEGKGWGLMPHPIHAATVSKIAERMIGGESLSAICRWLDAEHVPTPRNAVREYKGKKPPDKAAKWNTTSVAAILRSPAIIGEVTVNTEDRKIKTVALRDESGMAIKRAEPLISRQEWEQVNQILDDNSERKGPAVNHAALLHVAFCEKCEAALNLTSASWNGKMYYYYRCPNERLKRGCNARRIPADKLETMVETTLLTDIGSLRLTETVEIEGTDYSTQMVELAEAIGNLASRIALARAHGQDVSRLEAQREIHEHNLAALAEEPTRPAETFERETNETWADRWHRLDWNGRNDLMRQKGIRVLAKRDADGITNAMIYTGWRELDESGDYLDINDS